jgi:putative flippase GtrA
MVDTVLAKLPSVLRDRAIRHREFLKFALVGGTTFVIDLMINYTVKYWVLTEKPITARVLAVLVATIVSYVLNREWSFRTRGGRERQHEAALFFVISGIAIALTVLPQVISRYVLHLRVIDGYPLLTQEIADFVSGYIIGVGLGMIFRFWSFRRFVFPDENARPRRGHLSTVPDDRAA